MTSPVSASEFAAIQIRKSILDGTLEPGARIQQHALASELGVSHVPLREAIQRLEAEGFLAVHPRRGAFVMPLSVEDAREIFELRATLEVKALRASMAALTSEQLQIAREICAAGDGITDVVSYGELNVQFHRAVYAGAGRPRLQAMIETLWSNAARYSMLLQLLAMGSAGAVRDDQKAWLSWRQACGSNVTCLRSAYADRIGALKAAFNRIAAQGPF